VGGCVATACLGLALAGCSGGTDHLRHTADHPVSTPRASARSQAGGTRSVRPAPTRGYAVADPGRLHGPLLTPDLLVTGSGPIPDDVRRRVERTHGVRATLPVSLAAVSADGRTLTVAAADPGRFRRFTQYATARTDAVWTRVAAGEVAVDPSLPPRLADARGYLRLGASPSAPAVHIGAYAPLVPEVSAFVNLARARQLGMPRRNALLVSTGTVDPSVVAGRLRSVGGPRRTLQTLALEFHVDVPQTAVLTGGSLSHAVGTFSYTPHADGTVTPDAAWVRTYIRRETMPVIGPVTGNKGMLPQLRAALDEVVRSGLAGSIHPHEYGGCFVPRFIAHDPAKGLSLHTWGMAVDLNVPGNQRGTAGRMDRRVVAVFARWGFAWGGDWRYTDPMHFEMDRVVPVGRR
jgi:hypothetical protein